MLCVEQTDSIISLTSEHILWPHHEQS